MAKKYPVVAECVDYRTGKRFYPGDSFPDPEPEQAKRLTAAGCLGEPSKAAEPAKAPEGKDDDADHDRLDGLKKAELLKIAEREKVELPEKPTNKQIVAAIRAGRAKA